jgi:hypothetical protein
MTNEELLQEIASLPAAAKLKVEKYVDYLRSRKTPSKPKLPLDEEPVFGMWSDRDDMLDSTAWVRDIRETHWGK